MIDTIKKQTQRKLTDIEKLYFVREFFNTRMTQAAFAHLHNIDRKTFGRWLKKYGNVVQKEISNQQQQQQQQKEDKPASSESDMMVSIPYIEYLELLCIKNKFEVMCALSHT